MQRYFSTFILFLSVLYIHTAVLCQTSGDYRTVSSGVWTDSSRWEVYDGVGWIPATTYPTLGSGSVTISDSISIESNLEIDQLTVASGGKLALNANSTMTLQNGNGTDLTLAGELFLNGQMTVNNSTTIDSSGTITNNDSLFIYDGITISCNIANNGFIQFNGIGTFNGMLTTTTNSIISLVSGTGNRYAYITFARGFTNHGLLSMVGYNNVWGNPIDAILTLNSDSLLNASDGTIETLYGDGADRVIEGQLVNEGTINVGWVLGLYKPNLHHVNNGTIHVTGHGMYVYGNSTTFTNNGTLIMDSSKFGSS